jgi:ATP-dependent DNA helicase RecG
MKKAALKNLIALGEGFTAEFKRAGTSNLGREICAFANATGGVILIGVTDSGQIVGVDDHNRLMTEADLGIKSIPRNPLLFGMLYRMDAVEHIGSGIKRIRNVCREYGIAEPRIEVSANWFTMAFPRHGDHEAEAVGEVTPEVTPEVRNMLSVLDREMARRDIMSAPGLSDEKHFREHYQQTAIRLGLIEMTIPDKPRSRDQKYRLTDQGKAILRRLDEGKS